LAGQRCLKKGRRTHNSGLRSVKKAAGWRKTKLQGPKIQQLSPENVKFGEKLGTRAMKKRGILMVETHKAR